MNNKSWFTNQDLFISRIENPEINQLLEDVFL